MAEKRFDLQEDTVDLTGVDEDNPLNRLTDKQRAFVEHYCATGGRNVSESARAAGYSITGAGAAGNMNLKNEKILKALQWMAERKMTAAAYKATAVLEDLMDGVAPNGASVTATEIRKAAERIQDFNGILAIRRAQLDVNINDTRRPEEILNNIYDLIEGIGGKEAIELREKVQRLGLPKPSEKPVNAVDAEFEEDFSETVIE